MEEAASMADPKAKDQEFLGQGKRQVGKGTLTVRETDRPHT